MIAAANEAMRVQRSLELEVAALQQTMLSMRNQSQINNSAISGYQEGALWANDWLKRTGKEGSLHHKSYHGSLCCQRSIQDAKVVLSAEDVSNIKLFVLQTSLFLFEVVLLMFSNVYISI